MSREPTRRYPRTARLNEVVREVVAEEVERLSDPRLGFVTVTGVDVSPDLRHATVFYSVLGSESQRTDTHTALVAAGRHLRATVGHQVRMKYLPRLEFVEDPAVRQGQRIEDILRELRRGEPRSETPDDAA